MPPGDRDERAEAVQRLASVVSGSVHELRRPIALVRSYVSMLQEGTFGSLPQSFERPLQLMEGKLLEALQEVRQLSTLASEAGQAMPAQQGAVELGQAAHRAAERGQTPVDQADVVVSVPAQVRASADPKLLTLILDNLVQNALQYSKGRPQVKLEVGVEEQPFVRVQDDGPGMAPEVAARVFEPGFRANPDDVSSPGSGMGLSFSAWAARLMGGSLDLEWSRPQTGSAFLLRLQEPAGDELESRAG